MCFHTSYTSTDTRQNDCIQNMLFDGCISCDHHGKYIYTSSYFQISSDTWLWRRVASLLFPLSVHSVLTFQFAWKKGVAIHYTSEIHKNTGRNVSLVHWSGWLHELTKTLSNFQFNTSVWTSFHLKHKQTLKKRNSPVQIATICHSRLTLTFQRKRYLTRVDENSVIESEW